MSGYGLPGRFWPSRWAAALKSSEGAGQGIAGILRRLREHRGQAAEEADSRKLWSGRGIAAGYDQKQSSLEFLKGMRFNEPAASRSPSVKSNKTIVALVSPESVRKMERGVPMGVGELIDALVRSAEAGAVANSPGASFGRSEAVDAGLFSRGSAISSENRFLPAGVQRWSNGGANAANSAGKVGKRGRLSSFDWTKAQYTLNAAGQAVSGQGNMNPFYTLAEARAFSCLAAPPASDCPSASNCPPGGCPSEFAAYMSGVPFSGSHAGGIGILSTQGDPVPVTPNASSNLASEYNTAAQEQACEAATQSLQNSLPQLNASFQACCNAVESHWSNCHSSCFLGFLFCSSHCDSPANTNSQQCENNFITTYNSLSNAAQSACPNGTSGSAKLQADVSWYSCVKH